MLDRLVIHTMPVTYPALVPICALQIAAPVHAHGGHSSGQTYPHSSKAGPCGTWDSHGKIARLTNSVCRSVYTMFRNLRETRSEPAANHSPSGCLLRVDSGTLPV